MKTYATSHPTEAGPAPTDAIAFLVLSAGTAQAVDYPSGTEIVRLSGMTTAGAVLGFVVNINTSGAALGSSVVPSSGVTTATSQQNVICPAGWSLTYQLPGGSTGFSVVAGAAGYVSAEFWGR